jgi:hypothetical protein
MTAVTIPERLQQNFPFPDPVIDAIAETAAWQNQMELGALGNLYGLDGSRQFIQPEGVPNPVEILEVKPQNRASTLYDPHMAFLIPRTYGTSITVQTSIRVMGVMGVMERLAEVYDQPVPRIFVMGGPASPGRRVGALTLRQMAHVVHKQDPRPMVEPILMHFEHSKMQRLALAGYSGGQTLSACVARYCNLYGLDLQWASLFEPADEQDRTWIELLHDFRSTAGPEKAYIKESGSPAYIAAYESETGKDKLLYKAGLFRPTNLTLASVLRHNNYETNQQDMLRRHPHMIARAGWGTLSELAINHVMEGITSRTLKMFGPDRFQVMQIRDMHHAGIERVGLYIAMMTPYPLEATASRPEQIPGAQHSIDLGRVA